MDVIKKHYKSHLNINFPVPKSAVCWMGKQFRNGGKSSGEQMGRSRGGSVGWLVGPRGWPESRGMDRAGKVGTILGWLRESHVNLLSTGIELGPMQRVSLVFVTCLAVFLCSCDLSAYCQAPWWVWKVYISPPAGVGALGPGGGAAADLITAAILALVGEQLPSRSPISECWLSSQMPFGALEFALISCVHRKSLHTISSDVFV